MYRILSVSRNVSLLLQRNNVLAIAGFSVISPRYPEQTPALAMSEKVDAVVIGHSVDANVRRTVISELRRECPDCVICFVYVSPHKDGEPLADVSLDVTGGPEPLILVLQERLSKTRPKGTSVAGHMPRFLLSMDSEPPHTAEIETVSQPACKAISGTNELAREA